MEVAPCRMISLIAVFSATTRSPGFMALAYDSRNEETVSIKLTKSEGLQEPAASEDHQRMGVTKVIQSTNMSREQSSLRILTFINASHTPVSLRSKSPTPVQYHRA